MKNKNYTCEILCPSPQLWLKKIHFFCLQNLLVLMCCTRADEMQSQNTAAHHSETYPDITKATFLETPNKALFSLVQKVR